jgi:general stress protein YciG
MSAAIPATFSTTQSGFSPAGDPSGSAALAGAPPSEAAVPRQEELSPDRPPQAVDDSSRNKRLRGFAAMDRRLVSEIARKGGKAAHSAGTAHEFNSEEARSAGQKGGRATHARRQKETDTAARDHETKLGG